MRYVGDRLIYFPSDLVQFHKSEFAAWMERYCLDYPEAFQEADTRDDMQHILETLGNDHEQGYLRDLIQAGEDVCCLEQSDDGPTTMNAMQAGCRYIYQAYLQSGDFAGYSDLLVRVDSPSNLGNWSYLPLECKLAINPKPHFILQACAYCELLGTMQGTMPETFQLLLGNRTIQSYRVEDYIHFFRQRQRDFLQFMSAFDPAQPPAPQGSEHGRWQGKAERILLERDHLSQVANITQSQIRKLETHGITTMRQLAIADPAEQIPRLDTSILQRLIHQARLQVDSADSPTPRYEVIPPDSDHPQRGLVLLPPPAPLDVYFDMEGYPLVDGGLEYLFGVVYETDGTVHYRAWWAHNAQEEKQAFEDFIDWVSDRFQRDPSMHIYHYAPYETTAVKRLMGRYASREDQVDDLLRGKVFVDLYQIVRQGVRVGGANYSIKTLEKIYWSKREGEVTNAQDSVIQYFHWMQERDRYPDKAAEILEDIRIYNQNDCESTLELARWLRQLQQEYDISYCPDFLTIAKPVASPSQRQETIASAMALAEQLLDTMPPVDPESSEQWRIQQLLAHLLLFHRREEKPFWWQRFTWREMVAQDLYDELDCLAGIERTERAPYKPSPRSQSLAFEYRFDLGQDTKLTAGCDCWFVPQEPLAGCTLQAIDPDQGILTVTISNKKLNSIRETHPAWEPPRRTSLMNMNRVGTQQISQAIFQIVQTWHQSQQLHPPLQDLLERRSPRIRNHPGGRLIPEDGEALEHIIHAVLHLETSTLCIQGPPGSGKTYTAARIILRLLQDGKTVAVSSTSHKVISNLLSRVAALATEQKMTFKGAKVGGDGAGVDLVFDHEAIQPARRLVDVHPPAYQLVGATVFQCCLEENQGVWDYLFVDEAGQVSLANLLAKSRCANNLVLIGDQMQLEQPIQGSHPGESGISALGYFLQGQPTIPPNLGIFLEFSYRMHPEICQFISSLAYGDRLSHHPDTHQHQIFPPTLPHGNLQKGYGILFMPVEHEGNSQASDEEVEMVNTLVADLTGLPYVCNRGEVNGNITANDILVVAPYNMQVIKLKDKLGDRARVGTVDKFQGQEAPVVIISLCASRADAAPRGLEFLLNRNRLNVAISRAQCLAILVASPALSHAPCTTPEQMSLVNTFCKLMSYA
jgi:uncharacterized protein